jgi:4-nitrophenyl phosphatase
MVYGSAYTTARFIREKHPEIKKVRVLGMNSICKEMAEQGIASCGGEEDEHGYHLGNKVMTIEDFESYKLD